MRHSQKSLSYVDRGDCIRVTDPMSEYTDEDMSDEEWQAFIEENRTITVNPVRAKTS